MRRAVALTPALALLIAAAPARSQDPPRGEKLDTSVASGAPLVEAPQYPPPSTRYKVIAGGIGVTALAWGIGFGMATGFPEVPGMNELKIPIAGPWMALGKSGCATDDPDCGAKVYIRGIFLVLSGLAQVAGLGLVAEGIFMKTAPARAKNAAAPLRVTPFPIVGSQMSGLGLIGTF